MRLIFILLATFSIAVLTVYGILYYGTHYPEFRSLTENEEVYAKTIFGDTIHYPSVRIHTTSAYTVVSSLTLGNSVHIKSEGMSEETQSEMVLSPTGRFILIHELAHVHQYQHGGWNYLIRSFGSQFLALIQTGSRVNAYDWRSRVADRDPYESWNPEEQAEALAEFSREREAIDAGSNVRDTAILKLDCIIPLLSAYCTK